MEPETRPRPPVTAVPRLRLYSPAEIVDGAFRLIEFELDIARRLLAVPVRVLAMIDALEEALVRVERLLDRVEELLDTVDGVVVDAADMVGKVDVTIDEAEKMIGRVSGTVDNADEMVGKVDGTIDKADEMVGKVDGTIDKADSMVQRVDTTIDLADEMVERIDGTVDKADEMVARIDGTIDGADKLVGRAMPLVDFAEDTVNRIKPPVEVLLRQSALSPENAAATAQRIAEVIAYLDRTQRLLAPISDQVLESIDPQEIKAMEEVVDHLPALTRSLEQDVLPVLATLDTVAPEIHEILTVANECLEAISGIPGFKLLRRRGEDRREEEDGTTDTDR